MADVDTASKEAMTIDGTIGVALVDHSSGMALGTIGGGEDFDLTVAAAGNTDVAPRCARRRCSTWGDEIEDILITLNPQYHLIRPLSTRSGRACSSTSRSTKRANLTMARHQLRWVEENLEL